jgi:hypothetical protein
MRLIGAESPRQRIRELLNAAMRIEPDWRGLSVEKAGDHAAVMSHRHPDLSTEALASITN